MKKTINIFILAIALILTACSSDDTASVQPSYMSLPFTLTLHDGGQGTRSMGDPGVAEMPFVKPACLYLFAIIEYADGKTYMTCHKGSTAADWSDLQATYESDVATTDHISTYKGTLIIYSGDISSGQIYAIASTEELTLSGISTATPLNTPVEVTATPEFNAVTFDIPASITGSANINRFFRSVYNTPAGGCQFTDLSDVSVVLYHTATLLDIQWDTTLAGSSFNGNAITSISVNELPTKGIHAFTPQGNAAGTETDMYSQAITISEGNKYMGRDAYYVPSLDAYHLTVNGTDTPKGTSITSGLTSAPWVRINLK